MISLSRYRNNILRLFRLQIKTGMYVDVAYKGRAYRIFVEDLRKDVKHFRSRKESLVGKIEADKCPDCGKLLLNKVCIDPRCPGGSVTAGG